MQAQREAGLMAAGTRSAIQDGMFGTGRSKSDPPVNDPEPIALEQAGIGKHLTAPLSRRLARPDFLRSRENSPLRNFDGCGRFPPAFWAVSAHLCKVVSHSSSWRPQRRRYLALAQALAG